MGKDTPTYPDPADAAKAGIEADTELQPFKYLIDAASALGRKVTIGGKEYDFTGLGNADTAAKVSDQMAATLLALQKEKSPQIIAQRLTELKAADPQGYAARQQLFDRIMVDAQKNPDRPLAADLQRKISDELAKGSGFDDAKQAGDVRDSVRGGQVGRGIYLGAAPTSAEAKTMVQAGETLRNKRQAEAMALLESGATPEETAYRRMQQTIANLAAFQTGETPVAQFQQVSGARSGPVQPVGGAPNTNTFNPNAAGEGMNNALGLWNAQTNYNNSQANPWLSGLSIGANAAGTLKKLYP